MSLSTLALGYLGLSLAAWPVFTWQILRDEPRVTLGVVLEDLVVAAVLAGVWLIVAASWVVDRLERRPE